MDRLVCRSARPGRRDTGWVIRSPVSRPQPPGGPTIAGVRNRARSRIVEVMYHCRRMTTTRLLVITIDGLAGFYWDDPAARMPTLRGLAGSLHQRPPAAVAPSVAPVPVT